MQSKQKEGNLTDSAEINESNMISLKRSNKLSVVLHTCNSSTWEVEAGGLTVQGQPGLHNEILSQKTKNVIK
jgi:hypothetical protein